MRFCMRQIIEDHYKFLLVSLSAANTDPKRAAIQESLQRTTLNLKNFGYTDEQLQEIQTNALKRVQ